MPNVPIKYPPGFDLNGTEYESKDRWRIGNLVRFFRGSPQPVGGWTTLPLTVRDEDNEPVQQDLLEGIARGSLSWRDNNENRWLAIATTHKLYVFDGSELFDITPADLIPGDENANFGEGYGAYLYDVDDYGTPRQQPITTLVQEPGAWTLSTWGQDLVACPNWDGRIFVWSPGPPADTVAAEITADPGEVPEANRAVLVSNERHMVAIGAGVFADPIFSKDGRRIAWSTSENYTEWTPSITNSAGDLPLQSKGVARAGAKFRNEILIWTDIDIHRMSYIGSPFYYSLQRLSPSSGLASVNSYVVTSEFVFWVGPQGFYVYDGAVREMTPDVSDYYRDDVNREASGKIACGHNPAFNEIWTFYVSKESNEPDKYVVWNYGNNSWYVGELSRSTWNTASIWGNPVGAEPIRLAQETGLGGVYENLAHGAWRRVAETTRQVENIVVQDEAQTVTYVLDTDYEVDNYLGLVRTLSTGGIPTPATLYISYDQLDGAYTKLFNHEDGYSDDGASRDIWMEGPPFEIGIGDNLSVVRRIIQDTGREDDLDPQLNSDAVQIEFDTRLAPEASKITEGPYTLDPDRGYTDCRFTARQVTFRVRQVKDELWRIGTYRLEIVPGSGR